MVAHFTLRTNDEIGFDDSLLIYSMFAHSEMRSHLILHDNYDTAITEVLYTGSLRDDYIVIFCSNFSLINICTALQCFMYNLYFVHCTAY